MYSLSSDTWTPLARTPQSVHLGSLVSAGGYVYALRGETSRDFWRYDVAGGAWEIRAPTPASVGWGGSLAWDGSDTIYALRGALRNDFWMYSLSGDTWTPLAPTPRRVYEGGALVFVAGDLYALRGEDTVDFWRYGRGTDTSSTVANAPAPGVKSGDNAPRPLTASSMRCEEASPRKRSAQPESHGRRHTGESAGRTLEIFCDRNRTLRSLRRRRYTFSRSFLPIA